MNGIFLIVFGILTLLFRKLGMPSKNPPEMRETVGVIKNRFSGTTVQFYVDFTDSEGVTHTGKSIPYRKTHGKYYAGDEAKIKYYFSPKGKAFVIIDDDTLESCEAGAKKTVFMLGVIGYSLIAVGIVMIAAALV